MMPTPVAEQLYEAFGSALEQIDRAAQAIRGFDPATSDRRFRVAMSDIGEMCYLPPLMAVLGAEAPSVGFETQSVALDETARALTMGQLDFAIGSLPELGPDTNSAPIFVEHYVCLFRRGHPLIGEQLTLEQFERCKHIMVASPFNRLNVLTDLLTEQTRRQVAVQAVHFTSVPALVVETDLVVTLPSRVARIFARTHDLRFLPVPLDIPLYEVRLHWHRRVEGDAGNQWLRGVMTRTLSGV